MTGRLAGKVALITGASSGLGRAMAVGFAKEGASLAIAARSVDTLEETARLCRDAGAPVATFRCDVTDEAQVNAMVTGTVERFGALNVLVNNAGIGPFNAGVREYSPAGNAIPFIPKAEWDAIQQTNLTGPFLCMKAALPLMNDGGSVINIISISARNFGAGGGPYVAGKYVLEVLTKIVAEEQRSRGVRVNGLCPGAVVETNFFSGMTNRSVLRAEADADVIVPAAIFLASDESIGVTGQSYYGKWFNDQVAATGAAPRHGMP